jgi:uncharacterized Zn finger protein (UPF0148 family)
MTKPKPASDWQVANLPTALPLYIRRNIGPGDDGCWLWLLTRSRDGYGWVSYRGKTRQAHRLIYTLLRGEPLEPNLDHLCRVRHCVNPSHMEPVSVRENLLRGDTPTGWLTCRRCGADFIQLGGQRRCPECLSRYEAVRATQRRERRNALKHEALSNASRNERWSFSSVPNTSPLTNRAQPRSSSR